MQCKPEEVAVAFVRQPPIAVTLADAVRSGVRLGCRRVHHCALVCFADVTAFVVVAVDGGPAAVVASELNAVVTFAR